MSKPQGKFSTVSSLYYRVLMCERWSFITTELVARAPFQLRRAHARSVRAARARLRQQRRLEVDKTRKRDVGQTGGGRGGPREATFTLAFLGVGFPVVNWGSIYKMGGRVSQRQNPYSRVCSLSTDRDTGIASLIPEYITLARPAPSTDGPAWRCARTWSRRRVRGLQSAAELGPTARRAPACQTQSRLREWSTHYSPRAPVSLTRRLRRAVALWPEEPGLTHALTLLRRRHLLLHGHRAASPGAASLGSATRGAAMRGAACA